MSGAFMDADPQMSEIFLLKANDDESYNSP